MTASLASLERAAGATFVEREGQQVVADYGHPVAEHHAVRKACGMRDVSGRGRLELTGKDRQTWLHAICSQDIRHLKPGQGAYATCMNDVGRLLFDFIVWVLEDRLLIDLEGSLRTRAMEWLDGHLITEDVTIADVTEAYGAIEVAGPTAPEVLTRAGFAAPSEDYACAVAEGIDVLRSHGTGEATWQLWARPGRLEAVWAALQEAGARPYGETAFNTLRIEAGHPLYGIDMDDENNPLEAGLNRALNFDKGCYTGQEVMARLTFRQGPVRELRGLKAPTLLAPGTELTADGKAMGRVTSSATSPTLGIPIAIGYVRREHKAAGSTLLADGQTVEVVDLPWVRG